MANRVGLIQTHTNPEQWQHVGTQVNPADLCSRGSKAIVLASSDLWWRGPQFLQKKKTEWQMKKVEEEVDGCKTERTLTCLQTPIMEIDDPMWRLNPTTWSSWRRLTHVLAWVLRFVQNCQVNSENREDESLKPEEVKEAQLCIIRGAQQRSFMEYALIRDGKPLPGKSKLLRPKAHEDGIL